MNLTFSKPLFIFAYFLIICASGFAGSPDSETKQKKFVPEPVKNLDILIGDWEGDVHSEIGPVISSRELKVSMSFKKAFDGNVIQFETRTQIVGESKPSISYGTIAYDTTDKQFYCLLYSDSCKVYSFTGNWMNKYNLNFSGAAGTGSNKIKVTMWLGFKESGQIGYSLYTTIGTSLISDTGKLKRKEK